MERPNFIGTKKICGRLPLTFSSGKPAPLVATSGRSNFAQKNAPRPGKPPPRLHKKILITECGYAIYDKSKRPDGDSRLTRADKGEKRIPSDGPEQWA